MTANFYFEEGFWRRGLNQVAGIDEVGRGAWAGPVVAAAVILPQDFNNDQVYDSKTLTGKKRKELSDYILKNALSVKIAVGPVELIDHINILQATRKTMIEALGKLSVKPDAILVDAVQLDIDQPNQAIIKGDQKSLSIAAASIVAKVHRDELMIDLSQQFSSYGFEKNKGYGTKQHQEALNNFGVTDIHRRSFSPMKDFK